MVTNPFKLVDSPDVFSLSAKGKESRRLFVGYSSDTELLLSGEGEAGVRSGPIPTTAENTDTVAEIMEIDSNSNGKEGKRQRTTERQRKVDEMSVKGYTQPLSTMDNTDDSSQELAAASGIFPSSTRAFVNYDTKYIRSALLDRISINRDKGAIQHPTGSPKGDSHFPGSFDPASIASRVVTPFCKPNPSFVPKESDDPNDTTGQAEATIKAKPSLVPKVVISKKPTETETIVIDEDVEISETKAETTEKLGASPESSKMALSLILYPDEKSDDSTVKTRKREAGEFPLQRLEVGADSLTSDPSTCAMAMKVIDSHGLVLTIAQKGKKEADVFLGNREMENIHFYAGRAGGLHPYVDVYCRGKIPMLLGTVGLPITTDPAIIRGTLADYQPSLPTFLTQLKKACMIKEDREWIDYSLKHGFGRKDGQTCSPNVGRGLPAEYYDRRRSSRLADKPYSFIGSDSPPPFLSTASRRMPSRITSRISSPSRARLSSSSFNWTQPLRPKLPDRPVPLFVFPEGDQVSPVTITTADTPRLEPGIFLNDTLVDFDLRYSLELHCPVKDQIILLNSFFFQRLADDGPAGVLKWTGELGELGLFGGEYIVMPVCEHLHWYLVIICHPTRSLVEISDIAKSRNGGTKEDAMEITDHERECTVLVFDSLGRSRPSTLNRLKGLLQEEARSKLGKDVARERIVGYPVRCPRQDNLTDCGCFCGQFAEGFLRDPLVVVKKAVDGELAEWFPVNLAKERRGRLSELVGKIASSTVYEQPVQTEDRSSDIEELICL